MKALCEGLPLVVIQFPEWSSAHDLRFLKTNAASLTLWRGSAGTVALPVAIVATSNLESLCATDP